MGFPPVFPSGGGGIAFDTSPQTGGFLEVNTAGSNGVSIADAGPTGIVLLETDIGNVAVGNVGNPGGNVSVLVSDPAKQLTMQVGSQALVQVTNRDVQVDPDNGGAGGAGRLGFFGTAPVVKPAHPVTLADVIAVLTNYGLTA